MVKVICYCPSETASSYRFFGFTKRGFIASPPKMEIEKPPSGYHYNADSQAGKFVAPDILGSDPKVTSSREQNGDPEPRQTSWATATVDRTSHGTNPTSGSRQPNGFKSLFLKYWHAVVTYCAVFWSFGMCVAFLGPTLLDLGCQTSSDLMSISWVFLAQLLFSLVGASLAGYVVQR